MARGEVTVSGGTVNSTYGRLELGVNGATGTLVQTGGSITMNNNNWQTILGYGLKTGDSGTDANKGFNGGSGTYEIYGGSFLTPTPVFIGGLPTSVNAFAIAGGVGLLKVAGGSFTANNTMTVGCNGSGTLTIGSNGTCTVSGLVLTNNTASTLRCEFGANGLGTLTVYGEAQIATGAKLVVDLSQYKQGGSVRLLNCTSRSGSFASSDITILGASAPATVDQSRDEDIWLHIQTGTLIMFR